LIDEYYQNSLELTTDLYCFCPDAII